MAYLSKSQNYFNSLLENHHLLSDIWYKEYDKPAFDDLWNIINALEVEVEKLEGRLRTHKNHYAIR